MDRRCKYASKPCYNMRSLKDNGDFHTLCDFHRDKANHAQRRWYTRKSADGVRSTPARATDAVVKKEDLPLKRQRQRKVTSQAKMTTITVSPPPRKRGAVTFRNAQVTSTVLSVTPPPVYNTSPSASPNTLMLDARAISPMYEPYQMPLPWDGVAFPTPSFYEPVKSIDDWPVLATVSSPNDTTLMSLFENAQSSTYYFESIGSIGFSV